MKIQVFQDVSFTGLPDYNSTDVLRLLDQKKHAYETIDQGGLEVLSRDDADLLILPYVDGNFSDAALDALVCFHEAGGSLLVLGDTPHQDRWYPYRNMRSWRLHLTRCQDPTSVEGLTPSGEAILGKLDDLQFFRDRKFVGIRTTAFPPDVTHNLIRNNTEGWELPCVIAVERYAERFLGALYAQVGFNGGEPRENVDGSYQREWVYDPGMLTRAWGGCDAMIWSLIQWLAPRDWGGVVNCKPVYREGENNPLSVTLRNMAQSGKIIESVRLRQGENIIWTEDEYELAADSRVTVNVPVDSRKFGIHSYSLEVCSGGEWTTIHKATERVFSKNASAHRGLGVSTFWSFADNAVPREYRHFIQSHKDCGVQYLRANVPWEDVEPAPKEYNWRVPDSLVEMAREIGVDLFFWMFPTTRGSGLGDGGVPRWILKEPAIDKNGNSGYFPSLWSPYYHEHYFGMLTAFSRRYAYTDELKRLIFDYGNSDFPYGYYYYVNDTSLFDYSPIERRAFATYLRNTCGFDLQTVSRVYGRDIESWDSVAVPTKAEEEAWRLYLAFRSWSILWGVNNVAEIVRQNAPDKLPPDLPGHGLGSIADVGTAFYDVTSRHWYEQKKFDAKYVGNHNAGPEWGGEAWQCGGGFKEYDQALLQSLRWNATYMTIPGADLGVDLDDTARIGFIRREMMGATRTPAEIAVIDRIAWNQFQSLTHVASRMDQSVDLISAKNRFDFSCYKLLVLPDDELCGSTHTGGGAGMLLPSDEGWYWLLRECVEKGMRLLVFPNTCALGRTAVQMTFLRQIMNLTNVAYGPRRAVALNYPDPFGGGVAGGMASAVEADGNVLLQSTDGSPLLVEVPLGQGAILLAGYDTREDSLDGIVNYKSQPSISGHSLTRLAAHLGIMPRDVRTNQAHYIKDMVRCGDSEYLLIYSELPDLESQTLAVRLMQPAAIGLDLATGERYDVKPTGSGWSSITLPIRERTGIYIKFCASTISELI